MKPLTGYRRGLCAGRARDRRSQAAQFAQLVAEIQSPEANARFAECLGKILLPMALASPR